MSAGKVRIGIGGWDWRDPAHPQGLPRSEALPFASARLPSLEINATYHKRQKPETFAGWAASTPCGFKFAVKGFEHVANRHDLSEAGEAIDRFFAQGIGALGNRLGPLMWQFAPRKRFSYTELRKFLDLLPSSIEGRPLRHAFDARHASFSDPAFAELCRQRDMAIVYSEHPHYALLDEPGTSFRYARIMRTQEDEPLGLPPRDLDALAGKVRSWAERGSDVFLYFAGGAKARNPAAALALRERLDA